MQGWVDLGGGHSSQDNLPAKDGHLFQKWITRQCHDQEVNPRPWSRESDVLTTRPSSHHQQHHRPYPCCRCCKVSHCDPHVTPSTPNGLFTPPTRTRQNSLVWSALAVWTQLETRQNCLVLSVLVVWTQLQTRRDSFVLSVSVMWTQLQTRQDSFVLSVLAVWTQLQTRRDSFVLSVSAVWTTYLLQIGNWVETT